MQCGAQAHSQVFVMGGVSWGRGLRGGGAPSPLEKKQLFLDAKWCNGCASKVIKVIVIMCVLPLLFSLGPWGWFQHPPLPPQKNPADNTVKTH